MKITTQNLGKENVTLTIHAPNSISQEKLLAVGEKLKMIKE